MTTPYRNEIDALRERKASLESELARLREQTNQLDELKAREAELAGELAGVDVRLDSVQPAKRTLPLLDQVRVASPCTADWNEMLGDGRVRFCLGCEKNVYNLSAMSREAAESLLQERLGNDLCVRFYQRTDGTILTQDCPVGVKKKRRKKLALAVAGAGAMAAAAATMFMKPTCTATAGAAMYPTEPASMMGEMVEVKGDPAPVVPPVVPASPETTAAPAHGRWTGGLRAAPHVVPTTATPHVPPKTPIRPRMGKPTMR